MIVGWLEHDISVAVVSNIYYQNIIQQFVIAVATEFDLPGFTSEVIHTVEVSKTQKQPFVGTYNIGSLGNVNIEITDEGLLGTPDFYHKTYRLFPEAPSKFVNIATGTWFQFLFDDSGKKVVGFETDMARAKKL